MGMHNVEKRRVVSSESWRQTSVDNEVGEDREKMDRRRQVQHEDLRLVLMDVDKWTIELSGDVKPMTQGIHSLKKRERLPSLE